MTEPTDADREAAACWLGQHLSHVNIGTMAEVRAAGSRAREALIEAFAAARAEGRAEGQAERERLRRALQIGLDALCRMDNRLSGGGEEHAIAAVNSALAALAPKEVTK